MSYNCLPRWARLTPGNALAVVLFLLLGVLAVQSGFAGTQAVPKPPLRIRPTAATVPQYVVTDLGALYINGTVQRSYAYGINASGVVYGRSQANSNGAEHAFRWTPTTTNGTSGSIVDLGTLSGPDDYSRPGYDPYNFGLDTNISINTSALIVGVSAALPPAGSAYSRVDHAFGTNGNTLVDLGALYTDSNGYSLSNAYAVNSSGVIVGTSYATNGYTHGFYFDGSGLHEIVPPFGANAYSYAYGVNAGGRITGTTAVLPSGYGHAYSLSGGTSTDLGTLNGDNNYSEGYAINDAGQIVGQSPAVGGNNHAFLWTPGGTGGVSGNPQMRDLGVLGTNYPVSTAFMLSATGVAAGRSYVNGVDSQSTTHFEHAFYYDGLMRDLGALALGYYTNDTTQYDAPYPYGYYNYSKVRSVNAVGSGFQAVGTSYAFPKFGTTGYAANPTAFVFRDGLMYDLNHVLTGAGVATITLDEATGINSAGQIVANGVDSSGYRHAYLLTPTTAIASPTPVARQLYPTSLLAGQAQFTLAVNGSGFDASSVVHFGAATLTTTAQSDSLLLATVPASLIVSAGTPTVTVTGNGTSDALTFTIIAPNPDPAITSLSPNTTVANQGSDMIVMITGTGFIPTSRVYYNGYGFLPTVTYNSPTQLTVVIPASGLTYGGVFYFLVRNPAEASGYPDRDSGTANFTVTNPVPTITGFDPASGTVAANGIAPSPLTITGTNFVASGMTATFNGNSYPIYYDSPTQARLYPANTDFATAGNKIVTITNPAVSGAGGGTATANYAVGNANAPTPVINDINPPSQPVNGATFNLRVHSTDGTFVSGSQVKFNGILKTPYSQDANYLYVSINPATDYPAGATPGTTVPVQVVNPAPIQGGGSDTSNTINFLLGNPIPTLTSINPTTRAAKSGAFTMTVTGSGFVKGADSAHSSQIYLSSIGYLSPDFATITATSLTVSVPASALNSAGNYYVFVNNPSLDPSGYDGGNSDTVAFSVTNPTPVITSFAPTGVIRGAGTTVTVTGTGLLTGGGYVRIESAAFTGNTTASTVADDGTSLTFIVRTDAPSSSYTLKVVNYGPIAGGGSDTATAATPLVIQDSPNPVPTVSGVSPSSVAVGSAATYVFVNGTNFLPGSVILFDGVARTDTTYVDASTLRTLLTNTDLSVGRIITVTVRNPAPGGGVSASSAQLTIGNPTPTLTSLTPNTTYAGAPAFTLRLAGAGFVSTSRVNFGTTTGLTPVLATLTPTQIDVNIPASAVATAGTVPVTVVSPAPGGGTSGTLNFTVQAVATDVTDSFLIKRGGFRFNRANNTFVQEVTLSNRTTNTVTGPVSLVLDNLVGTLVNRSGTTSATTPSGQPYITVTGGSIPGGSSVSVILQFTQSGSSGITYSTRVLAGSSIL